MFSLLFSGLFSAYIALASFVDYDEFQAVRVSTGTHAEKVAGIVKRLELDTWRRTEAFVDIIVPPSQLGDFNDEVAGLDVEIIDQNLGRSIAAEHRDTFYSNTGTLDEPQVPVNQIWFTSYHPYAHHLGWLGGLQNAFPNKSNLVSAGRSFEGRNITGIHIFGSSGGGKKPAVVFHGTVHAREWITTKVVQYTAFTLLANYSADPDIRQLVDDYDFFLFPIVNPDGFVYTEHNRLWRKSRQPVKGSKCSGRDLNRNWPWMWGGNEGSSGEPCSEIYRGEQPADAPETQGLILKFAEINAKADLKLFIDWHSYSQLLLWPYAYTDDRLVPNDDELRAVAKGARDDIAKVHGTNYTIGPAARTIYAATGTAMDYAHVIGAEYSYAVELRDKGKHGFLLPKEEILPTCEESFAGVKSILKSMK